MCGLFGASTHYSHSVNEQKFLKQAAIAGSLRGVDSTGYAFVNNQNIINLTKSIADGPNFINYGQGMAKDFDTVMSKSFVTVGHNRAATVGKVDHESAHPFQYGSIVGAHNGTLLSDSGLTVTNNPVDSQNLMATLAACTNTGDIAKQYVKVLEELDGAYALTWYNQDTEILYFARNDERPLSLATSDTNLYWASERGMLTWLLQRNKLYSANLKFEELPVDVLRQYDTNTGTFLEDVPYTPKVWGGWWSPGKTKNYGYGYGTTVERKSHNWEKGAPIHTDFSGVAVSSGESELEKLGFAGEHLMLFEDAFKDCSDYSRDLKGWVVVGDQKYPAAIYFVEKELANRLLGKVISVKLSSVWKSLSDQSVIKVTPDVLDVKYRLDELLVKGLNTKKRLKAFRKRVDSLKFPGATAIKPRVKLLPVPDGYSKKKH